MSRAEQLLLAAVGTVVERIVLEPRAERTLPIPAPYATGDIGRWVEAMTGGRPHLWRHQSLALEMAALKRNVVVATGTASGKSLVFMAPVIDELLNGTGKALIFYPQKALGGDQLGRFRSALELAGLDPDLVGAINGDVEADERDRILSESRVILATPDVVHAWLMRQVQTPIIRSFLERLRIVVLDEAHVFEGVFGSNVSFLFRRLRSAHSAVGDGTVLQWIAATATILNASDHLEQLTGCPFHVVDEQDNGAPFHGLTLLHIHGPERGSAAEKLLADACSKIANDVAPNAFIAFADSRQGVEHVAKYVGRDDVLPYRGGYVSGDRRAIEALLHENELRGVVSTSALELGIDIPQFEVGINLGIPQTRKALRQRIGRIGRSMPGAFAVIAPATAFAELGGTFREYTESEVEPSRLYLHNRSIQVQNARCLLEEHGEEGAAALPGDVSWPDGFAAMYQAALPGAIRAPDLDQALAMGSDCPHHAYPLRAMREAEFALRNIRNPSERLGTIDLEKALRETYPGATYYHLRRAYRVVEWRMSAYEHSIMLEPVKGSPITHAILGSRVSVSTAPAELIDNRLLTGAGGMMAEVLLKVADSVDGYRIGSAISWYRDLRKINRRLTHKIREFASTGVALRIQEPWFEGTSEHAVRTRQNVAEALSAVLAREHNIAPSEIRTAHERIALYGPSGPRTVTDAIVLFDNVVGGLRLTSPLFSNFSQLLDRLEQATKVAGERAILQGETIGRLRDWHAGLKAGSAASNTSATAGEGEFVIFAPGSKVYARRAGQPIERTIVGPMMVRVLNQDILGYRYECEQDAIGWLPHDQVEAIGHDWRQTLWNPATGQLRELAA